MDELKLISSLCSAPSSTVTLDAYCTTRSAQPSCATAKQMRRPCGSSTRVGRRGGRACGLPAQRSPPQSLGEAMRSRLSTAGVPHMAGRLLPAPSNWLKALLPPHHPPPDWLTGWRALVGLARPSPPPPPPPTALPPTPPGSPGSGRCPLCSAWYGSGPATAAVLQMVAAHRVAVTGRVGDGALQVATAVVLPEPVALHVWRHTGLQLHCTVNSGMEQRCPRLRVAASMPPLLTLVSCMLPAGRSPKAAIGAEPRGMDLCAMSFPPTPI